MEKLRVGLRPLRRPRHRRAQKPVEFPISPALQVDALEHGAAGVQHATAVASFKQFLPVDTAHERHGQAPVGGIQDLRHRDPALQGAQRGVLTLGPGQRAGSLIALHDCRAVAERAVGVAVPQRPHALILVAAADYCPRRAWAAENHAVCVMNAAGKIVAEFAIEMTL